MMELKYITDKAERKVKMLVAQLCLTLCNPIDCGLSGQTFLSMEFSRLEWVAGHSLIQEIFLTQGLNLGILCCRQILYYQSHQGSRY